MIRRRRPELRDRIDALDRAVGLAEGRLPVDLVEPARELVARSRDRLRHGTEWTVVALAGATGSGKSSIFNALAGETLSRSSVQRPTTGAAHACVWGEASAESLLAWLGVTKIHRMGAGDPDLEGLVLLDLPDHDSVRLENRLEMSRLVELVDLLVWILDPEKYADAALHDGFLRPLSEHGDVMLFVLNQVDRLSEEEVRACLRDLAGLLDEDGIRAAPVVPASALTGLGVADVRARLATRVGDRRAAVQRIEADLRSVVAGLTAAGGLDGAATTPGRATRRRLVAGLSEAAGVPVLLEAIARGYRRDAADRVGWPVTRWLSRFRAHPLRRLGLGPGREAKATSLPRAGRAQLSVLRKGLRDVAEEASRGLAGPWPARVREAVLGDLDGLVDPLDQAISSARLELMDRPGWWTGLGGLQTLLLVVTLGGLAWLGVLFGFSYLRLPAPPTPEWRGFPAPTLMALGGVGGGLLTALVGRGLARIGGRRRARRAEKVLGEQIEAVAERQVLAPLEAELETRRELAGALAVARGEAGSE